MPERIMGTLEWSNSGKGDGFIERQCGPDGAVHYSATQGEGFRNLIQGQQVESRNEQRPKGPQTAEAVYLK
jgi:CspA family cold shock protein